MRGINVRWVVPIAAIAALLAIALTVVLSAGCRGDDEPSLLDALETLEFHPSVADDPARLERIRTREQREARERARQSCGTTWQRLLAAAGLPLTTPYSRAALERAAWELVPPYFYGGRAFIRACVAAFRSFDAAAP